MGLARQSNGWHSDVKIGKRGHPGRVSRRIGRRAIVGACHRSCRLGECARGMVGWVCMSPDNHNGIVLQGVYMTTWNGTTFAQASGPGVLPTS